MKLLKAVLRNVVTTRPDAKQAGTILKCRFAFMAVGVDGSIPRMTEDIKSDLPEGVREGNEKLVLVTEPAGAKLQALVAREEKGEYLRIKITGGGCNGLSYKMKFVSDTKRGDILVRSSGAQVLVDTKSALYLRGTHLDFSDKMVGGGFKFSNPNAKSSCSCGESFSI
jgi:iron-sulfur cluster assembly protein